MRIIRRFLILIWLLPSAGLAWQKVERPLGDRLKEVSLVIVARVVTTESRQPSPILGVGDTWQVRLQVSHVLKGAAPKYIRATFTDASVQDFSTFRPDEEQIWLLAPTSQPSEFIAPSSHDSILLIRELAHAKALLSRQ